VTDRSRENRPPAGLLLAAGAGSRFGRPKALVADPDGTGWLARALGGLVGAGCSPVYVVLGAAADEARSLLPDAIEVVVAPDWAEGIGASLRTGLTAITSGSAEAQAVVVMLVDTPGVDAQVAQRVVERASRDSPQPRASLLARAAYRGRPGHPVLIGRDHWPGVIATARGDHGAREYLRGHDVTIVECGDLGSGDDLDTADDWQRWLGDRRRIGDAEGRA
jgi:CTP:molybdopterin cytidylyltransferase MocA